VIVNLSPNGDYAMADLDKVGGMPLVLKKPLKAGLLHDEMLTVTGRILSGATIRGFPNPAQFPILVLFLPFDHVERPQ
jgi:dihydroxyacid dehydratase/phosphogluconate dehydratase